VTRLDGALVRAGASLSTGEAIDIKFGDAVTRRAVVDGEPDPGAAPGAKSEVKTAKPRGKAPSPFQGDLF
jgi:exodeoxyribonuclease VII large subunit